MVERKLQDARFTNQIQQILFDKDKLNGRLIPYMKYWHVSSNEIEVIRHKCIGLVEETLIFLKFNHPPLYIYVCKELGFHQDAEKYMQENKRLKNYEEWSMHIHGYFIPWLE